MIDLAGGENHYRRFADDVTVFDRSVDGIYVDGVPRVCECTLVRKGSAVFVKDGYYLYPLERYKGSLYYPLQERLIEAV